MVSKVLEKIGKIGEFINKYTGSSYGYTQPSGELNDNFEKIGEVFGIPVWVDAGKQYENEFLDFPSLGDILESISEVGINFDIQKSDCTVCLVITYSIPLIKYPPITICLEKPDCKKEEKKEESKGCIPLKPDGIPEGIDVTKPSDWREPPQDKGKICDPLDDPEFHENLPKEPGFPVKVHVYTSGMSLYWGIEQVKWNIYGGYISTDVVHNYFPPNSYYVGYFYDTTPLNFTKTDDTVYCNGQRVANYRKGVVSTSSKGSLDDPPWYMRSASCLVQYSHLSFVFEYIAGDPPPNPPKPKPVPIPDPVVMKDCCDELKKILARIEKKVNNIQVYTKESHKVINPNQFFKKEVQVPANWIYPGNATNPVVLDDLPDLISAVARLVDRRLGYLPQLVRIKDADPLKEGDQEMNLVVNSLADASRLILEYLLQAHGDIGGIQMMNVKNLYESGITHQIAVTIKEELEAISAFLGYEGGTRRETFKMAFNPKIQIDEKSGALDKVLPRFIRDTRQQVEVPTFSGTKTVKDFLIDIKRDSSNTAASVTRKLSDTSLDDLVDEAQNLERLKRLLLVKEIMEREGNLNLKEFLEDAEQGYPSSDRSEPRKKPYGFAPTDKPKMNLKTKKSRKNKYKQPPPPPPPPKGN